MNNRGVHIIGMGTMLVSLLIFGVFLLLFVNFNTWVQGLGHPLTMSVYLQDGISDTVKDRISSFIKDTQGLEIERSISKKQAMRDLKNALGSRAGLLEGLSSNPLPASIELLINEMDKGTDPQGLKKDLENLEGVEEVQYSDEWLKKLEGLMDVVRLVALVIGGLLCIGVLFIVTNTIKLTIYSRIEEIEILKLVGATDWFVKAPFLLEGIIQGLVSGGLAFLVLFSGYSLLSLEKMHFLNYAVLDFVFLSYKFALLILLMSAALGLAGSFIAVGRFFKV
ncbi:MAG: ABC transporter permease [Desulfobacterales bacterium]|nr:ABC transporter permease [Desulfobacterales bacterium]